MSSQTQSFQCPHCGAPLQYTSGMGKTIKCTFCGSSVIVPKELRTDVYPAAQRQQAQPQQIPQVMINVDPSYMGSAIDYSGGRTGMLRGCISAVVILIIVGVTGGGILLAAGGSLLGALLPGLTGVSGSSSTTTTTTGGSTTSGTTIGGPKVDFGNIGGGLVGFATQEMKFGSEGTGPGLFDDARHVAVDSNGNIYVGDYQDGRIQIFDPSGTFVTQVNVDKKLPLTGMTVGRDGTIYAVYGGVIHAFDHNGQSLGDISAGGDSYIDTAYLTADNGLVVASTTASYDNVVRLDSQGKITLTIDHAISTVTEDSELDMKVAVDGVGNIYALGTFNNGVFKFNSDGKYQNRFGKDGDEPGNFRAPYTLAVDGQGRVYVSDFKGIQVFDNEGRYVDVIKPPLGKFAYGLFFDTSNNLWVAAGTEIYKYKLNK